MKSARKARLLKLDRFGLAFASWVGENLRMAYFFGFLRPA